MDIFAIRDEITLIFKGISSLKNYRLLNYFAIMQDQKLIGINPNVTHEQTNGLTDIIKGITVTNSSTRCLGINLGHVMS